MQNKTKLQYYIVSAIFGFGGLSITSAIYVSFLMKNGLSLLQVNQVNSVFFLTLFICEVPTGAFADIFGRKRSFVLACAFLTASMFIYGSSHTFVGFLIAEIATGIGLTFRNGAFTAWFVDSMRHHGYTGDLKNMISTQSYISQICGGAGAILGAYLMESQPSLPWYAGGTILAVLTVVVSITMKEEYFKKTSFSFGVGLLSMKNTALKSVRYAVDHVSVRFVLIVTFVQILAVQALNMYWQPYFLAKGIAEVRFGWLFSGLMTFVALGAFLARKKHVVDERKTIIVTQMVTGVIVIATVLATNTYLCLILFLAHEVPRGFLEPIKDTYLHKSIPSAERATISSFCSIAPHIGGVVGLLLSGVIAQSFGISTAWVVSGCVFILGSLLIAKRS